MNPQGPGNNYGNTPPQGQGYNPPPNQGQWSPQQGGYPPQGGQPGGYPVAPPPKKGNNGLIIGIIAGVVVIAVVVAVLFLFVFKSSTSSSAATDSNGVPTYPSLKKLDLPADQTGQITSVMGNIKGAKIDVFTTADAPTKISDFYKSEFTKGGWKDATEEFLKGSGTDAAQLKQAEAFGILYLIYQKDSNIAAIISLPGSLLTAFGGSNAIPGVSATDTLLFIVSGPKDVLNSLNATPTPSK
jgi:hypothetical protein